MNKKMFALLIALPLIALSAKSAVEIRDLTVEATESIDYDGSEGMLVKFKGVKKRVYLPKENNSNPKIFALIEKAKDKKRPLKLKLSRIQEDIVMYRSGSLTEVLTIGGDCKKLLTKSKNPRLFCSKGYAIKRAELGKSLRK